MTMLNKKENTFEVLDIWKRSLAFFNTICIAVGYFPGKAEHNLDEKAKASALSIARNIARSSNTLCKKELNDSLEEAVESVASTISALNIASQQNYLRKDLFQEMYLEGKLLAKRIENFKLKSNINLN